MRLLTSQSAWCGTETVLALGMFDGVHEGHAQLIRTANHLAALHDLQSVVLTFDTHPLEVLSPKNAPGALSNRAEKVCQIASLRPNALIMRPFDADYAALLPEAFVKELSETLKPRFIVVGFNYSFGHKGMGTPDTLIEFGKRYGFETVIVGAVEIGDEPVSSTRIRRALSEGDVQLAQTLLGRPYTICGVIKKGKGLGHTLGFPTANLSIPVKKASLPRGVYAAKVWMEGDTYNAVLNIGKHPTTPDGEPSIEVHLLDAKGDFYGKHMRIELLEFLRPEKKFDSLDDLKAQIARDKQNTERFFS